MPFWYNLPVLVEDLKIGYHVTKAEHTDTLEVVEIIRKAKVNDRIKVVGGRQHGCRISRSKYWLYCDNLGRDEGLSWYRYLNSLVMDHGLSANQIQDLPSLVRKQVPETIRFFLDHCMDEASSDMDLLIVRRPPSLENCYHNGRARSGLTVEVWQKREFSYVQSLLKAPRRTSNFLRP